jgi:hypothetical protein
MGQSPKQTFHFPRQSLEKRKDWAQPKPFTLSIEPSKFKNTNFANLYFTLWLIKKRGRGASRRPPLKNQIYLFIGIFRKKSGSFLF